MSCSSSETTRPASVNEAYRGFYPVIAPLIMAQGIGDGQTTACLVAQAATIDALRKGKSLKEPTDKLDCACPLLRRMAISANDTGWWKSDAERTEVLRPLIPLLLDSRVSLESTKKRAALFTNTVIHSLTPMRLEWIASNTKNEKLAASCRDGIKAIEKIGCVTDKVSAIAARDALSGLKSSAYASAYAYASASAYASAYADADASADTYASAYADAYAYADASASASASASAYASASADAYAYAYASAYASADASADASASAYADADADADADAQKIKYRTAYLELFRELAAIKD